MEFDIPAESARNIMGIMLCLVIPYRVRPETVKKIHGPSGGFPWDKSEIIT